jgi:hypothetical protein
MMRIIRNLTALMFGFILGAVLILSLVPTAESAESQTYLGILVAYQDGNVIASQSIGYAPTLTECLRGLQVYLAELTPKPGVSIVPFCPLAPSAPVSQKKGDTNT